MSGLFHESVPDDDIVAAAKVVVSAKWYTYRGPYKCVPAACPLCLILAFAARKPHMWRGVSVEPGGVEARVVKQVTARR